MRVDIFLRWKKSSLWLVLSLQALFSSVAFADEIIPLLYVGAGVFDVDKNHPRSEYQLEYKVGVNYHNIRPIVGLMATDRGSTYVYGGFSYDIFIGPHFAITPSFAPGIYFRAKGKDLGFPLEFRSSFEISYIFKSKGRLGAQFYHLSNASLGHRNPGTECLLFFYAIPFKSYKSRH